mgnify:CR=1 FL=1
MSFGGGGGGARVADGSEDVLRIGCRRRRMLLRHGADPLTGPWARAPSPHVASGGGGCTDWSVLSCADVQAKDYLWGATVCGR